MTKGYLKILTLFLVFISIQSVLLGQEDEDHNHNHSPLSQFDSTKIDFFFAEKPEQITSYFDTTLHYYFEEYDPTRERDLDYVHLGNLGSPHKPLFFTPNNQTGHTIGLNQYDLYRIKPEKLKFYNLGKSFTEVNYSQTSEQSNGYFRADFSRNFANNLNVSIDVDRIFNQGEYLHQRTKNTAFSVGLRKKSLKEKLSTYFIFTVNTILQENNGGITTDSLFGTPEGDEPLNIPVFLTNALTLHDQRSYYLFNNYQLNRPGKKNNWLIAHQLKYETDKYKFADQTLAQDSAYYQGFQIDSRGLRFYMDQKKLQNKVYLTQAWKSKSSSILSAGIDHNYYNLNQEPSQRDIQNLAIFGDYNLNISETIQFNAYGRFHLLDNAGDFLVRGLLSYNAKKLGSLEVSLLIKNQSPSIIQQSLNINQQAFWNNDWDTKKTTHLKGVYRLPNYDLKLEANFIFIQDHIYFNENRLPEQANEVLSLSQFSIQKNFKFWRLHIDNILGFQTSNRDYIRFPDYFSKHSLYYENYQFKGALLFRGGINFRYYSSYFAEGYFPLTGQFYNQTDTSIGSYPQFDAFISAKIQSFRVFLKYENFTPLFSDDVNRHLISYPDFRQLFRIGLNWRLTD